MSATTFLNFGPELDRVLNIVLALQRGQTTLLGALAALDGKTDNILAGEADLKTGLEKILTWPGPPPDTTPASVRFVVVTTRNLVTGELIPMAQSLINDSISNIPLEFDNVAGQKVAPPVGGTVTLTLVNTADGTPYTGGTAAMGADGSSVDVTPTPADGTVLGPFTLSYEDVTDVDLKATLDCEFTADARAANVHFVTTGITTRTPSP